MDTDKLLLSLFGKLREFLERDYGFLLSLTAEAVRIALRVRTKGDDVRQIPAFVLTVQPAKGAFRISYRPQGQPPAQPETRVVGYDERGLRSALFGIVQGYVETERKRLIEYRQGK
jgi:hypothetical protein